jgi:hypothetical protein
MDLGSSPAEIIALRYRLEDPQMATAWKLEWIRHARSLALLV